MTGISDAPQTSVGIGVLDNPTWTSLTTAHAHLAEIHGRAARFPADVGPFGGVADDAGWPDLATLVGPDNTVVLVGVDEPPPGFAVQRSIQGVQLVGPDVYGEPDPEAIALTDSDVPEMLDLVRRTEPGPFLPRTIRLGGYVGFRRDGALVAMAGERMRPPGWTEISAVCTDPAWQGHGLASRLIGTVIAAIRDRGETPFLHTAATNTPAIRVYERLGFTLRRTLNFTGVQPAA